MDLWHQSSRSSTSKALVPASKCSLGPSIRSVLSRCAYVHCVVGDERKVAWDRRRTNNRLSDLTAKLRLTLNRTAKKTALRPSSWNRVAQSKNLSKWTTKNPETSLNMKLTSTLRMLTHKHKSRIYIKNVWIIILKEIFCTFICIRIWILRVTFPQVRKDAIRQEIQAVNIDTLGKVFQNLEIRIQVCLDVKGDHFQHRLWPGPVLYRSRYVYIHFQVIIPIT